MFCPNCKAEYRPGFTKCSDCGVDLVEHLSSENLDAGGEVATDSEGRELLWSGLSPKLQQAICGALDAAHIAHKETEKGFGLLPTMAQSASFIWVDRRDRPTARSIVDKIFADRDLRDVVGEEAVDEGRMNPFAPSRAAIRGEQAGEDTDSQDALTESDDSNEPTPDDVVEDFDEADATTEVWAGDDEQTADYLELSLNGVGIGCVVSDASGNLRVLVMPESEKRAKEIVREVVEGAPPQ
jgi:hypothetical protein